MRNLFVIISISLLISILIHISEISKNIFDIIIGWIFLDHGKHRHFLNEFFAKEPPKIFFVESSLASNVSFINIRPRQACSIESAALSNPNIIIKVFVLTRSDSAVGNRRNIQQILLILIKLIFFSVENSNEPHIQYLLQYDNVEIELVQVVKFFQETPLHQLFDKISLFDSLYNVSEITNAARFTLMFQHGGIYLDLGVIVQKPLDALPNNSVCAETSEQKINVAYIKMDRNQGRKYSELFLK